MHLCSLFTVNFSTRHFHFSSGTSSARAFSGTAHALHAFLTAESWNRAKLLARSLRFEENPARTISKKRVSSVSAKKAREIFSITSIAESTEGGGEKFPLDTFATIFGVPYAFTDRDRILFLWSRATI